MVGFVGGAGVLVVVVFELVVVVLGFGLVVVVLAAMLARALM